MTQSVTATPERVHHPYSPSTLQNLEWCPDFKNRQTAKLHQRTIAGTRGHDSIDKGEDDERLGDDDAVAVAECLDFVEQRRRIMAGMGGEVVELSETYLPIDDEKVEGFDGTTAGYADRILVNVSQQYAEGFDWKFGKWAVEKADNNTQAIAYVLGIFKRFPMVERVRFWFRQPLLEYYTDHMFERKDLPALMLRVQVIVARAREARGKADFSRANPGVPVCNFCAHLGVCPKVPAFACRVGRKFHPVEVPENISPTTINDPDQISQGLRLASVLKVWVDAFRRQVTNKILQGDAPLPPGQKIQEMSKRSVVDAAKLKVVALRYLTQAEYESTLDTTFGALEDLVSEKAPRGAKKSTVEEFREALVKEGAVEKGDSFSFLRAVSEK